MIQIDLHQHTVENNPINLTFIEEKGEEAPDPVPETPEGALALLIANIIKAGIEIADAAHRRREQEKLIDRITKLRGGPIIPHSPMRPNRAGVFSQTTQFYARQSSAR